MLRKKKQPRPAGMPTKKPVGAPKNRVVSSTTDKNKKKI